MSRQPSRRSTGRPLLSGWPGGPRRVPCLGCARSFVSQGKANRICPRCSKLDRPGDAEARGALTGPARRR